MEKVCFQGPFELFKGNLLPFLTHFLTSGTDGQPTSLSCFPFVTQLLTSGTDNNPHHSVTSLSYPPPYFRQRQTTHITQLLPFLTHLLTSGTDRQPTSLSYFPLSPTSLLQAQTTTHTTQLIIIIIMNIYAHTSP